MNKNFWILGLAVAALTSCTQGEVVDVPESRAIGFDAFTNKSTRALEALDNQTLNRIHILGYEKKDGDGQFDTADPLFENITATGDPKSNNAWSYEGGTKYWELYTTYRFAAYANGLDDSSTENVDESKLTYKTEVSYNPKDDSTEPVEGGRGDGDLITFTDYENNGQKDLIASISGDKVVGTIYPTTRVSFTFNHMLSKLELMFGLNSEHNDYDIYVSDFIIKGIYKTGTGYCKFKLNSSSVYEPDIWWETSGEKNQSLTSTGETKLTTTQFSGIFYMIPQKFEGATIEFTMTKKYKGTGDVIESKKYQANLNISNLTNGEWKPGYHYRYKKIFNLADVQLHPIEFTVVNVAGWTNASPDAQELNVVEVANSADSN